MGNVAEISSRNMSELVDAKRLADYLHFDVSVVRKLAKQNMIPALRIRNGNRDFCRFRIADVEEALKNGWQAESVVSAGDNRAG